MALQLAWAGAVAAATQLERAGAVAAAMQLARAGAGACMHASVKRKQGSRGLVMRRKMHGTTPSPQAHAVCMLCLPLPSCSSGKPIDGDVGGFKQLTPRTQRGYLGSTKPLAFSINALIDFVLHAS